MRDAARRLRRLPGGQHQRPPLLNRTDREARFLVVGTKAPRKVCTYSNVDLVLEVEGGQARFTYKDGTPCEGPR